MKPLKVSFHSVIDVITNSSTEIYTYPTQNASQLVKDIINCVLKDAGSKKSCDDLYDIEIKLDEGTFKEKMAEWEEYGEVESYREEQFRDMNTSIVITAKKEEGPWFQDHKGSSDSANISEITEKISNLFYAEEYSSD